MPGSLHSPCPPYVWGPCKKRSSGSNPWGCSPLSTKQETSWCWLQTAPLRATCLWLSFMSTDSCPSLPLDIHTGSLMAVHHTPGHQSGAVQDADGCPSCSHIKARSLTLSYTLYIDAAVLWWCHTLTAQPSIPTTSSSLQLKSEGGGEL